MSGWEDFDRATMTLTETKRDLKRLGEEMDELRYITARLGAIARTVMNCRPKLDTDDKTAESITKELRLAVMQWERYADLEEQEEP